MRRRSQGDRILIPCIDVDGWLEGALITGSWVIDQCSTLLLLLEIEDAITLGIPASAGSAQMLVCATPRSGETAGEVCYAEGTLRLPQEYS